MGCRVLAAMLIGDQPFFADRISAAVDIEGEVFLRDFVVLAAFAYGFDGGVEPVLQLGSPWRRPTPTPLPRMAGSSATLPFCLAAGLAGVRREERFKGNGIRLDSINASSGEILIGLVLGLVFLDLCRDRP